MFAIGAVYACIAADYFREWRFIEISLTFPVMIMLSYPWFVAVHPFQLPLRLLSTFSNDQHFS